MLPRKEVVMDKDDASNFFGIIGDNIDDECYEEGCTFKEVMNYYGQSEPSHEYWNTYQCKQFKKDCKDVACRGNPLGMENDAISGGGILASSWYSPYITFAPFQGRLNNQKGSWCANRPEKDPNPYLQVELPQRSGVCAVATQGSSQYYTDYVTKYEIQTSLDRENWETYKENGTNKVFSGNTNAKDMLKINLDQPVLALFIRFVPKEWHSWPCMRVEVYGQPANCTVRTTDNKCCVFPFLYEGERFFACTSSSFTFGRKWCATTYNYDKDGEWGDCLDESLK
ncbi:lactadherin-like isoform X2 [Orbicella faveolata]|uniref:lactadherin-like isoform X2 n=1 Tax=Orbicella faveolata TaxID=48498 RepID=UPI0009E4B1E2|nr:lactadherin-like isoform X2 [Orbicella faveolata]